MGAQAFGCYSDYVGGSQAFALITAAFTANHGAAKLGMGTHYHFCQSLQVLGVQTHGVFVQQHRRSVGSMNEFSRQQCSSPSPKPHLSVCKSGDPVGS